VRAGKVGRPPKRKIGFFDPDHPQETPPPSIQVFLGKLPKDRVPKTFLPKDQRAMEQEILEFVRKWDEELMSARERVYAQDVARHGGGLVAGVGGTDEAGIRVYRLSL
jgi:hypothetical protein